MALYPQSCGKALAPWNDWCNGDANSVRLPSGQRISSNRGVGQGEPEGPLKAALAIADAEITARTQISADGRSAGAWFWFIDDGKLFLRPRDVDAALRALDVALHKRGVTRGAISRGNMIKSTVKYWIPARSTSLNVEGGIRRTCRTRAKLWRHPTIQRYWALFWVPTTAVSITSSRL